MHKLELLMVFFTCLAPTLLSAIFWKKVVAEANRDDLDPWLVGALQVCQALGALGVIFYVACQQESGLDSIGWRFTTSDLLQGLAGLGILVVSYSIGHRLLFGRNRQKLDTSRPDLRRMIIFTTPAQRGLRSVGLILGVLAEEVVYRGYLIVLWGARTESPVVCAVVASILFVIAHLYQGRKTLLFHLGFAAMLAIVTVKTGSIGGAIIAHMELNVIVLIKVWGHTDRLKSVKAVEETKSEPEAVAGKGPPADKQ